jgi:hypothetical protein
LIKEKAPENIEANAEHIQFPVNINVSEGNDHKEIESSSKFESSEKESKKQSESSSGKSSGQSSFSLIKV